jgi:hypothetical protein
LSNLLAERRLTQMKPLGSAAEVERIGHSDYVPEMT